jgi:hypothetical protein
MMEREAEEILKYKDLTTELERSCDVKTKAIPEMRRPTGNIRIKIIQKMSEQHSWEAQQAYWGSANTLRNVPWDITFTCTFNSN